MGLFFNTCSNCGRWVPRSVNFCRHCGSPNDHGWVKCWSCGTQISPASKHCFKCGVDQADQRSLGLIDGRWARQDEDIALKIETDELEGYLTKGLDVEQGTQAALFQHGRFIGEVGPGRYTADSVMKRLTRLAGRIPTTILLYDASDHEIVFDTDGLRTSDGLQVSASYKAVLRLTDAPAFVENLFKSRRTLKLPALAGRVSDEMRGALKSVVATRALEDLFESPEARAETETSLRAALDPVARRYGMVLGQLAFIDFFSPDYEALAGRKGELTRAAKAGELDMERLKLTQRLRRAMTQEKMDKFSNEMEFEEFVRQTEHELGMHDVIREDEMARLKSRFSFERDREGLVRRIEIDGIRNDAARAEARKALLDEEEAAATRQQGVLARRLAEARNEGEIAKIKAEQRRLEIELDHLEVEKAIEARERKQAADRLHERELLEVRSKATAEALLSVVDGPAAERLARLAELERKEKLSPEQLFAIAASADPEVAAAYAREKGIRDYEEVVRRQEEIHAGYADRMERLMQTALEQMGRVASPAPGVAFPGMPGAVACAKCSGTAAPGMAYCPQCGGKLR